MGTASEEPDTAKRLRFLLPGRGPAYWVGVGGGLGLLKPAPGTWGSLLGLPLGWWVASWEPLLAVMWWVFLLAAAWACCRPACEALGSKDPGAFVADEYAALAGVFLLVPFGVVPLDWVTFAGAFGLFRLFDIWKPWPVSVFDRMGGAAGVMLDDVVAAIYAAAGLALLRTVV